MYLKSGFAVVFFGMDIACMYIRVLNKPKGGYR